MQAQWTQEDGDVSSLRRALKETLREYISNHTQVIVPYEVLRLLQISMQHLGDMIHRQQDAQEILSFLMVSCTMGLDPMLPDVVSQDGVILCGLTDDARVSGLEAPVDILGLILTSLSDGFALIHAAPLLIMRLENIYDDGDGEYFVDARGHWPQGDIDLSPCLRGDDGVAAQARTCPAATYTLRDFIAHLHSPGPPQHGMRGGHYIAYTCREGTWYVANDSCVEKLPCAPDAFPYLVFLERADVCPPLEPLRTREVGATAEGSGNKRDHSGQVRDCRVQELD